MRWGDDVTFAEDGRRADPKLRAQQTATGETYWVLGVRLPAGRNWPVDAYTRLMIWQDANDGPIHVDHGRYWPVTTREGTKDEDDGA